MIISYASIIKISLSHQSGFEWNYNFDFGDLEKWGENGCGKGRY